MDRTCERCGSIYRINPFDAWRGQRFCSEQCRKAEEGRRYRLRKRDGQ